MDCRLAPHPSLLTWTPPTGARSKAVYATFQGRKLRLQTPLCRCRLFRDSATASLYLYADDIEAHNDFWAYVQSLEEYCLQLVSLRHLEMSSCIRNGTSIRLNVWESTEWFDDEGKVSDDADVEACRCLLELTGCWISPQKWGLKWKVVQIKKQAPAATPATSPVTTTTTTNVPCLFLDD